MPTILPTPSRYQTTPDICQFFNQSLLLWFDQHGRHDLPWQVENDPYAVWVSEIMLQQTQVKTVLHYFPKFMERFPTVHDLAQADWEEVAPYWAGLGYYARARNLHKASKIVVANGHFPNTLQQWQQLPGIGRSTAGALMSLGLRQYGVILDGNVKRVLARFFALEDDLSKSLYEKQLWQLASQLCPQQRNADYTQAIMDLGATICTPKKSLCAYCPLNTHCQAHQQNLVDELPFKKSKKTPPIRTATVLILEFQHQWLWHIRPSEGIWGGLWSLPILESPEQLPPLLQNISTHPLDCTTEISHTFSHFTWQLKLQRLKVTQQELPILPEEYQWFSLDEIQLKAIPTAMQKIIQALSHNH